MSNFVIVTDSCCDLTHQLAQEMDLAVIHLNVLVENKTYTNWLDWRDISAKDFYDLMRAEKTASTSAPSIGDFVHVFEPILQDGKDILYLGFSSALSSTVSTGMLAAQELMEQYPDRKAYVVDTLCASLGEGLLVWYACRKRDEGMSLETLRDWVEASKLNICHWFTVDDLMFLKRGGRVSATTALVGTMLQVKPVLHVDSEGHLINVSKARGRKASIDALAKKAAELGEGFDNETMFISHGDCAEDARYLADVLKEKLGVKHVHINHVGAVIGSHAGPGVLALFFLGKHR